AGLGQVDIVAPASAAGIAGRSVVVAHALAAGAICLRLDPARKRYRAARSAADRDVAGELRGVAVRVGRRGRQVVAIRNPADGDRESAATVGRAGTDERLALTVRRRIDVRNEDLHGAA